MIFGKAKLLNSTSKSIDEWNHYYNLLKYKGLYHSPAYIKTLESRYDASAEVFIFEADFNNLIYYPYFKRSLAELPFALNYESFTRDYYDIHSSWYYGGPIGRVENQGDKDEFVTAFVKAFSEHCRESNIVSEFIRFDPIIKNHIPFEKVMPLTRNRESVYVDLNQSEESIWMNMAGRARTAIRKAERLGVNVRVSDSEQDVEKFCKIYTSEMERKNAPTHYHFGRDFIQELFDALGNKIILMCAEVEDVFFSGGLFVYEIGEAAHYYLMATDYDYLEYQANNLILHKAMLYFKRNGVKTFDLQGGREGVFNFKKSFSKTRANFYTCGIVHNHSVYDKLTHTNAEFTGESGDRRDFFPAYRIKDTN